MPTDQGQSGPDRKLQEPATAGVRAPSPEETIVDDKAKAEQSLFVAGDEDPLGREQRENEHRRREGIRDQVATVTRWFVAFIAALVGAAILAWSFHMVAPAGWRWLGPADVEALKTILFSGALSALVAILGKRYF